MERWRQVGNVERHFSLSLSPFTLTPQTSPSSPFFLAHVSSVCCTAPSGPSSSSSSSGMCAGVLLTQHSPHRGRITTRQSTCPSMRCRCRVAALCEPRVSVKARHEHSAAFALNCWASPDCGHSTVKTLWHLLIMYTCKHFGPLSVDSTQLQMLPP